MQKNFLKKFLSRNKIVIDVISTIVTMILSFGIIFNILEMKKQTDISHMPSLWFSKVYFSGKSVIHHKLNPNTIIYDSSNQNCKLYNLGNGPAINITICFKINPKAIKTIQNQLEKENCDMRLVYNSNELYLYRKSHFENTKYNINNYQSYSYILPDKDGYEIHIPYSLKIILTIIANLVVYKNMDKDFSDGVKNTFSISVKYNDNRSKELHTLYFLFSPELIIGSEGNIYRATFIPSLKEDIPF